MLGYRPGQKLHVCTVRNHKIWDDVSHGYKAVLKLFWGKKITTINRSLLQISMLGSLNLMSSQHACGAVGLCEDWMFEPEFRWISVLFFPKCTCCRVMLGMWSDACALLMWWMRISACFCWFCPALLSMFWWRWAEQSCRPGILVQKMCRLDVFYFIFLCHFLAMSFKMMV